MCRIAWFRALAEKFAREGSEGYFWTFVQEHHDNLIFDSAGKERTYDHIKQKLKVLYWEEKSREDGAALSKVAEEQLNVEDEEEDRDDEYNM